MPRSRGGPCDKVNTANAVEKNTSFYAAFSRRSLRLLLTQVR